MVGLAQVAEAHPLCITHPLQPPFIMHKLGRRAFIYHDWLTVALLSFAKESTPCSVLDLDRKRKRKRRRPRLADPAVWRTQ